MRGWTMWCSREWTTHLPRNLAAARRTIACVVACVVAATHGARRPQLFTHAVAERNRRALAVPSGAAGQESPVDCLERALWVVAATLVHTSHRRHASPQRYAGARRCTQCRQTGDAGQNARQFSMMNAFVLYIQTTYKMGGTSTSTIGNVWNSM